MVEHELQFAASEKLSRKSGIQTWWNTLVGGRRAGGGVKETHRQPPGQPQVLWVGRGGQPRYLQTDGGQDCVHVQTNRFSHGLTPETRSSYTGCVAI